MELKAKPKRWTVFPHSSITTSTTCAKSGSFFPARYGTDAKTAVGVHAHPQVFRHVKVHRTGHVHHQLRAARPDPVVVFDRVKESQMINKQEGHLP